MLPRFSLFDGECGSRFSGGALHRSGIAPGVGCAGGPRLPRRRQVDHRGHKEHSHSWTRRTFRDC